MKIYEQLIQNKLSKPITAQWFAKLLNDASKDEIQKVINKDCEDKIGISYIIDAIKHVTE